MDAFDRSILRFVSDWAPYGGPNDDAATREFGLSADSVLTHFSAIITAAVCETRQYGAADRELLRRAWVVHKTMCLQLRPTYRHRGTP
jgi:hypothetical protein